MHNLQRQLDNDERRIVVLERICMQQEIELREVTEASKRKDTVINEARRERDKALQERAQDWCIRVGRWAAFFATKY